jgi:hypothetical protein
MPPESSTQPENPMSADKDRAIRRQKQKRATALKTEARDHRGAAGAPSPAQKTEAKQPA